MALTKITTNVIEDNAITADKIDTSSLTAAGFATEGYVTTAVANLVDSAPLTLDTLNELAAALGDDPNFATTVTNSIGTKLPLSGGTLTGSLDVTGTVTADGLTVDGTATIQGATGTTLTVKNTGDDISTIVLGNTGSHDTLLTQENGVFTIEDGGVGPRLSIADNGDLSLYEDTGTTPALTWDASAQSLNVDGPITADGLSVDGNITVNSATASLFLNETDTTDENTQLVQASSTFRIRTIDDAGSNVVERLRIDHGTGNLSLYEDTGTTAKFFWDASAESLLIGQTNIPTGLGASNTKLIIGSFEDGPEFVAYNSDNAIELGDKIGAYLFGNDDNNATEDHFAGMWAKSAGTNGAMDIHFAAGKSNYEDDSPHMTLDYLGNVGINTSSPANKLDVRNTSTDYQLHLGDTASTVLGYELGRENTGGLFKFYGNQTGATGYIFSGVDGERMRIDTTGRILAAAGSAFVSNTTTTSTSKTLVNGEECFVDTAAQTITLPASPSIGDNVTIFVGNFTDTIIARNGANIMGLAENLTIDVANMTVNLVYINASTGWRIS
jgi:hypothetical protein